MKKIIITTIALFLALPLTVWAVTAFNSKQVGDTPVDGYILQTNGEISTWVATSSLGIIGTSQWTTNGSSIYYNTGNVGIGTTTPISKLTVDGNTEITGNITLPNSTSTITLGNFSNISALFDMALGMNVDTGLISGLDFKNSNSSGQVRLLARNNQNDYLVMNTFGSGNTATFFGRQGQNISSIFSQATSDTDKALAIGTINAGDLILGTANTERMVIKSTGNVGIGTTSPSQKLEVSGGNIQIDNNRGYYGRLTTGVAVNLMRYDGSNNALLGANSEIRLAGSVFLQPPTGGNITITGGATDGPTAVGTIINTLNTLSSSTAKLVSFRNTSTEQAFIGYNGSAYFAGNVGIGTTSPGAKLEVWGGVRISGESVPSRGHLSLTRNNFNYIQAGGDNGADGALAFITAGRSASLANTAMYLKPDNSAIFNGNVGIGTTTPIAKLSVTGSGYFGGNLTATGTIIASNGTFNDLDIDDHLMIGGNISNGIITLGENINNYHNLIFTNINTGGFFIDTRDNGDGSKIFIDDSSKFSFTDSSENDVFAIDVNNGENTSLIDFSLKAGLKDDSGSLGSLGSVLSSTGTSTLWMATTSLNINGSQVAYVSATGSDMTGRKNSPSEPFATLNAAVNAIDRNGTVYIGPGIFPGEVVNVADVTNLKLIGTQNGRTIFRFGDTYTSFTNVSGVTWRAPLIRPITYTDTANPASVQQLGTSYGAITNHHPVDRGAPYRMQNTPLEYQVSTTTVGGGNGRWSFDSNYLYISKTDGGDPNGATYMVSSQTLGDSLIVGGALHKTGSIEVHNIEVHFAYDGFDLKNVANARLTKVMVQGATNNGIWGYDNATVELVNPEISDVGNDAINFKGTETGATSTTSPNYRKPYISVIDPWVHDSFDKGIVAHERTTVFIRGGLIESAPLTIIGMAGVMAFAGGNIHADGVTVRGYTASEAFSVAGSVSAYEGSDGIYMRVQNSVVENSRIGFRNQSTGKLVVYDSTVVGNTLAACYGGSATQYVECNNVVSIGNGGLVGSSFANAACNGCKAYTTASPEGVIAAATGTMAYVNSGSPVASVYVKKDSSALTTGWKRVDWASSTQVTNGINYYNGTDIVSSSGLVFNSGKIGLGISSPAHMFDISNSTATTSINLLGLNSTNAVTGLSFGRYWDGASSYRQSSIFHYLTPGSLDVMAFAVAGTGGTNVSALQPSQIKMVLEASGKLGIATTTPATTLDVNGTMRSQVAASTTVTCTAALMGASIYSRADDHFYGCRASGWSQLDN